jgi:hypothetical protein
VVCDTHTRSDNYQSTADSGHNMVWSDFILLCAEFDGLADNNSHLLAVRINEPNPIFNDPGAIYVWIIVKPSSKGTEKKLTGLFNLDNVFSSNKTTQPRAYQLPYSRKLHKAIVSAQRKAKGTPGSQIRTKKGTSKRGNSGSNESPAPLEFKIVNPVNLLPK